MGAPRTVYAAILLSAVLCVVFIAAAARSRIASGYAAAGAKQEATLQRLRSNAGDFFSESAELVRDTGAIGIRVHDDTRLLESLLAGLMQERRSEAIYGLGFFYAPYAFSPSMKLYGPYVKADGRGLQLIRNVSERDYDYVRLPWYRRAVRVHGDPIVVGPYREGRTFFISTLAAFSTNGSLRGVATVDARRDVFIGTLKRQLEPGQIAYAARGNDVFIRTAPLPADRGNWMDVSGPIATTHSTIHLLTNASALRAERDRVILVAALASLLAVAVCVLLGAMYERSRRAQEAARTLQDELRMRSTVEAALRKTAFTDELTGMPNRAALRERIADAIDAGKPATLYLIDLDRFNVVNETFNHAAGDEVLRMVGERLRHLAGADALRIGGDEFVVLVSGETALTDRSEEILSVFATPFAVQGTEYDLSASVGAAFPFTSYRDAGDYLRDADIALYEAKNAGRARAVRFSTPMRQRIESDSALEVDLHRALREMEFVAYYQPIVDAHSLEIDSFEMLARWVSPRRGILSADAFIPFAERRGLVAQIDMQMLALAAREAGQLLRAHPQAGIAVNISSAHLNDERLIPEIARAIQNGNIPPDRLQIEITETAVMRSAERAQEVLGRLRDLGVRSVVDDFGVGHSSLAYLQKLPINGLKIDRSFVALLAESDRAQAIIRAIVALGDSLGLKIVAEGIETKAQADTARELGVRYLQGFFFAKPAPAEKLVTALPS